MMFELDEDLDPWDEQRKTTARDVEDNSTTPNPLLTTSSSMSDNPFRFDAASLSRSASMASANSYIDELMDAPLHVDSPTAVQRSLCLNATSALNIDVSDSDSEHSPTSQQQKLCLCASLNPKESQEAGQRSRKMTMSLSFPFHTHQITQDYTVSHEIIGIGESGKVMACYAKESGQKFALKVLRDTAKARREVDLHYLTNNHENVVTIIDIYENTFDGVKCLLMVVEFLEGGDLLSQFENQGSKPYSEKKVGEIIRQIGSAVQYLHDMNIAHRDIKLENILCSSTGDDCVYKLGDYGFAKRPERNCLMESPCCTPFYAPPEVLGRERYDKSCDMWSLGVAMYILLCGYPPFYSMKGLALSPGMRSRIAGGVYAFPHEEWDPISQSTKDDIRCLLRTDPSKRMTIHQLMATPLVRGDDPLATEGIPIPMLVDEKEEEEEVAELPAVVPRSVRFLRDGVKAPRLHSIQEEVGRALEMMRMGHDNVFVKSPQQVSCNNHMLARRRGTAHLSIPRVHC